MSKTLYILLQCELLKTLHWNLSKKHLFKLWGEEKKYSQATLPKICYFCPPFCFFNPPFCKPSVLQSKKHLFATYPAPNGHWMSTLTPFQHTLSYSLLSWPLASHLYPNFSLLYQLNYSYQSQEANINSKNNKIVFSLYT